MPGDGVFNSSQAGNHLSFAQPRGNKNILTVLVQATASK
jgi:hypothetical protein